MIKKQNVRRSLHSAQSHPMKKAKGGGPQTSIKMPQIHTQDPGILGLSSIRYIFFGGRAQQIKILIISCTALSHAHRGKGIVIDQENKS